MKIILKNKPVDRETLSYRQGVIGIVIDNDKNFLLVQMVDYSKTDWRFPGGGVNAGESLETALLRELKEELGSKDFEIVKKSRIVNKYDWPDIVVASRFEKNKKTWRGQEQSQFLVEYTGRKNELNPNPLEIRLIKWVKYNQLKNHFTFPNQWKLAEKVLAGFNFPLKRQH
jgi:putative (di)nucleoside polyphosphate hydrolase